MPRSKSKRPLRLALGGITAAAPRASRSALIQSTSNALSPSRALKSKPSISGGTPTVSCRWPGSGTKRTKSPSASARATILVVRPRRASARWPGPGSPPFAARLVVGGDDGAVDQGVLEVRLAGQAGEDALEHAALHPPAEALEHAVPFAEPARQVAPGNPRPHPPQHRFEEQPVVLPRRAGIGRLARQQRRHLLPSRVVHHEAIPIQHAQPPPKRSLNHERQAVRIPNVNRP